MAIASVLVGVLALVLTIAGVFLTPVRYVGAIVSFGAPLAALVGIVMSGVAMSRAKQMGESSGLAITGLVLNIVGFVLGALVALTCGMCNAACSKAQTRQWPDGGARGGGRLGAELYRHTLAAKLNMMQRGCAQDPTGARNAEFFHPSTAARLQSASCAVTPEVVRAYGQSCLTGRRPCSEASQLEPSSPQAQAAIAAGVDPTRCYLYRSGEGSVVLCDDGRDTFILQWENIAAVR